jgi:site-specific recombinase XerD
LSQRRTIIDWNDVSEKVLLKGGDNFEYCQQQFLKSLRLRNLSERTAEFYQENLVVIKRTLHELKMSDKPDSITYENLQDILYYCMDELNNSPGTINHRISTMKQFFKFLFEESYIKFNPAEKLTKQKTKQVKINPFTESEIKALMNTTDKNTFVGYRDYVAMMLLLDTGIRLSELTNIRLHDISLENN